MRRALVALGVVVAVVSLAEAKKPYLKKPKRGLQMRTAAYAVEAGADREWCEYRRVDLKKPMDVGGFEVRMPEGAHHFVVWGYGGTEQDDSKFPPRPVESVGCTGFGPGGTIDDIIPRVFVPIQTPNSRFQFPKGVAMRVEPGQQLLLNPHLKNFGATDTIPDIRFNFYAAKKGTVEHYVDGFIIGNMDGIDVPGHDGTQTITAEWTAPETLSLVLLTTHQHQLGTYANIELVEPDGVTTNRIYENTDWEHPINYWPSPALRLEQGRKIRITCTWENPTPAAVRFGPNTTDEMCFILGFYYREPGATGRLGGPGCVPARSGLLCPLAPLVD